MTRPQVGDLIPLFKKAPAEPYARPADWLTLPTLTEGQQKVVGLHAVFPHDSNFCAFTVSGAYTVDWGDGTTPQNYVSGATAYHVFNYANISSSTECTRGYRQAIVTITPQAGQNLTSINFGVIHNQAGLSLGYSTGWLDVGAVGESVEYFNFGGYNEEWDEYIVRNNMLEAVWFVGGNNITNFGWMFENCYSLQSIPQLNTSSGTNFSGMFDSCYSLQSIPQLDTSSGTNFRGMFHNCYSLQSIPQLNTSSGTDFRGMFDSCYSLQSIPQLNTSSGTDFGWMFYSCYFLQSIPQLNTSSGTDFGWMFYSCYFLQSIPQLDTSSGTDFRGMFDSCYSLQSIPQLNTSSGTDFGWMFENCYSLQSIPQLNTSSGTDFSGMFHNCYSLSAGKLIGTKESISYRDCRLSRQALIDIFNGLATATGKTITITGNWGASLLTTTDRQIATNKGWTITG